MGFDKPFDFAQESLSPNGRGVLEREQGDQEPAALAVADLALGSGSRATLPPPVAQSAETRLLFPGRCVTIAAPGRGGEDRE